jgi:hypothetical protein
MIGQVTDYQPGRQLTIETRLDPRTDPFLIDHKMGGRPLLPAVIEIELCAEAASLLNDRHVVGLRDVRIHAPLPFPNDDCRTVRVTVTANETGASCELTSDHFDRKGRLVEADRLIMSANAELADAATDLSIPYCGLPWIKTFYPFVYDDRRAVVHGPRFQSLKGVYYQYDGGFARIIAPPLSEIAGARGDCGWHLPPSVLDACLFGCSTYGLFMFEGRFGLPLVFERIRFAGVPRAGEECIVRIYYRGQEEKKTFYDFNVFGEDQRVLLAVEGFHTTVIPQPASRETWTHTFDASRVHMPVQ